MKRFFGRKLGENIVIENDEFFHLKKVLRMQEGDKVIASVNDEYDYYCTIATIGKNDCLLDVDKEELCPSLPQKNITLFQMMPKKDYFDNILPKSIELGVSKIVPFSSQYTMVKTLKRERVLTQVMTACKQCERSKLVEVEDVISFKEVLKQLESYDVVIFAYENETMPFDPSMLEGKQNIAVVVGNEAGFTDQEASEIKGLKNTSSISLGKRILRCDTAVVATLSLVSVLSGN